MLEKSIKLYEEYKTIEKQLPHTITQELTELFTKEGFLVKTSRAYEDTTTIVRVKQNKDDCGFYFMVQDNHTNTVTFKIYSNTPYSKGLIDKYHLQTGYGYSDKCGATLVRRFHITDKEFQNLLKDLIHMGRKNS